MITFPVTQTVISKPETKAYTMVLGQNERMAGSVPVKNNHFEENIAELNEKDHSKPKEDNSFGFGDIVDMINPLQHIPIVSQLYQSATGDTIGAVAMIIGGGIFGGPIGALTSAGIVAYQAATREDIQQQLPQFEGTTIALADLRQGYRPYNT